MPLPSEPNPSRESEPSNIIMQPNQVVEIDTSSPVILHGALAEKAKQYGKVVAAVSVGRDKMFAIIDRRDISPDKSSGDIDYLLISADEDETEKPGFAFLEKGKPFHIGRDSDCTACTNRFDLSDKVSGNHLSITYTDDGKLLVHNFEPTNGTTLFARTVQKPVVPVRRASTIQFSKTERAAKPEVLELRSAGEASIASDRHPERNEDATIVDEANGRFGVFDGMGGHAAGDIASREAKSALLDGSSLDSRADTTAFASQVDQVFLHMHASVKVSARFMQNNMGTTATVAFEHTKADGALELVVGNIGDSRAYLLRNGELVQLTLDDSIVKTAYDKATAEAMQTKLSNATSLEGLSDEERGAYNTRSILAQAIGVGDIETSIGTFELRAGDKVLLCTDGVHDNLTDRQIQELLQEDVSANALADGIARAAHHTSQGSSFRSKQDDISAIVLQY